MQELNLDFLELYKSVDKFLKDAYSTSNGVSEYIRQMEINNSDGKRCIHSWSYDYEKLKHIRWVRNQLAHEVGYDSDICEPDDFYWLKKFYDNLFSSKDPLAMLRTAEQHSKKHQPVTTQKTQMTVEKAEPQYNYYPFNSPKQVIKKRKSLFQIIKDFFLGA
ncbi:DUF6548 family protein [Ruminococcus flavefaciens]|uniref:DUF6548 family protein n=1 Tax=Ruminococcus flavefaciens TaxID=1265 RepID=UPI0004908CC5|nr:DUF6548 family protein [Ruminococcus flavefaciens]